MRGAEVSASFGDTDEITDQRATKIIELLSLQVVVEDPYVEMIPVEYSWNEERLDDYAQQLLSQESRLRVHLRRSLAGLEFGHPLDQIDQVICVSRPRHYAPGHGGDMDSIGGCGQR